MSATASAGRPRLRLLKFPTDTSRIATNPDLQLAVMHLTRLQMVMDAGGFGHVVDFLKKLTGDREALQGATR